MNGYFYNIFMLPLEFLFLRKLRRNLLNQASGKILEIGFGTGLNFPLYNSNIQYTGIEPDESMRLVAVKNNHYKNFVLLEGDAQGLEFSNDSFDTVVATLVFCTIPDPNKAIDEVWRVLRPGGRFLLIEHVRRHTPITGRLLDILTPAWKHIAGGCHLNRDPKNYLIQKGFQVESEKILIRGLGKVWILKKNLVN